MKEQEELDFDKLKRISIDERESRIKVEEFARGGAGVLDSLPNILKAKELREFTDRMKTARNQKNTILWMFGGHIVKCGLAPLIIDLMERGYVTAIAGNGSVAIHDSEIALFGKTSEDVKKSLPDGMFGTTKETADFLNNAVREACRDGKGYAEVVGEKLLQAPYNEYSLLAAAARLGIHATIHPAMGAEVNHIHPHFPAEEFGRVSYQEFKRFANTVAGLKDGLVLNWGSAVVMPEIFLKALSAARNIGCDAEGFTSANFDMIQHYRPTQNVLLRPTEPNGKGYAFTGHHELMLPLLRGLLLAD